MLAFSTHCASRNSSISRSLIRYLSALPFFTLKSGGCAMKRCPASITCDHVPEEERQQQGADVGAVHVGVRHQDDLVVAQLADVELLGADPGAERRDEQPDFIVGQDLVVARLLRVDDLAAQRQHRLGLPVAALLGRAAGGVALDQEDLAELRIPLRAVGELGRRAPRRRARPCGSARAPCAPPRAPAPPARTCRRSSARWSGLPRRPRRAGR